MSNITSYDTTAANNTSVGGVSIAEGWAPANVNNALRALMADIAQGVADGDFATTSGLQPLDATLTALAGVTTAADKVVYATGADTFATTDLTSYGRTLIGYASAAALKSALGTVTVTASSITSPGYVSLDLDGDGTADFTIQWGSASIGGNGTTSVSYPTAFTTFSIAVISGARTNNNAQDNDPGVTSCGLTSFNAFSASDQTVTGFWVAVGK